MNKIVIIGGGNVGITLLYTIVTKLKDEVSLVLIDNNTKKASGNIEDLYHTLFTNTKNLKLGNYDDVCDASLLVIATGIPFQENRKVFLKESFVMIKDIMAKINNTSFNGNIIVVSNPNDVLTTYVAKHYLYPDKVMGTGTLLDIYRMKYYLAKEFNCDISKVKASILGEHGLSQVVKWEDTLINNKKVSDYYNEEERNNLQEKVKNVAYKIVEDKGYTNFGISACCYHLIELILNKQEEHLIVSHYDKDYDVSYSKETIIKNGIIYNDVNKNYIDDNLLKSINKIKNEYDIMVSSKTIGIDLDDTITDLYHPMHNEAKKFDLLINGKGIINQEAYLVGEKYGWSDEEKDLFFTNHRIKAINKARVRKDAVKVLQKLRDYGYKIIIITARNSKYYNNPYEYTKNWLHKHHIPYDKLIVNSSDKVKVCLDEKIDIFVDDMPNNCEKVAQNSNIKVYMMDNIDNNSNCPLVTKIKNFQELCEVIINEK